MVWRRVQPADIAAGFIVSGVADEDLWLELAEFLLDSRVQRSDREPAFERLARSNEPLPGSFLGRIQPRATQLLTERPSNRFFDTNAITPWPAALRFLAVHNLLDLGDVFDAVASLAGQAAGGARREAAVTAALLGARHGYSDLLVMVLSLSGDDDAIVKANAGRALASYAHGGQPLSRVAKRRLRELLDEDGLLVPRLVLREMSDTAAALDLEIQRHVSDMATGHPSWSVRAEARSLLNVAGD